MGWVAACERLLPLPVGYVFSVRGTVEERRAPALRVLFVRHDFARSWSSALRTVPTALNTYPVGRGEGIPSRVNGPPLPAPLLHRMEYVFSVTLLQASIALEWGDLSPLLAGDLSPSNHTTTPISREPSDAGRALAGRQVGQQPKRRQVAALQNRPVNTY